MNNRPYREIMYCPITQRDEEVFFYENKTKGELVFMGCDHQFNGCSSECKSCCEEAWQKVINRT